MSKKILLGALACIALASAASAQLNLRVGADMEGRYAEKDAGTAWSADPDAYANVLPGFSLGAEYSTKAAANLELGLGLAYRFPRSIKNSDADNVYAQPFFVPAYALVRLPVKVESLRVIPTGRLGYGFVGGNERYKAYNYASPDNSSADKLAGGLYWAAGLGFELGSNLYVEGLYGVNLGKRTSTYTIFGTSYTDEYDLRYSAFELSLGYRVKL